MPSPQVCVLYPDVGEPYARITSEILNGIEERLNAPKPCTLALPEQANKHVVQGWLSHHSPNVVITLGRLATRVFEACGSRIPSVIGALDLSPETRPDASGISLAVDPGAMFDQLKRMAPRVKRVFFAYEPGHDGWLLEHARKEAAARGLELRVEPADGVLQGAERYGQFVRIAQPYSDAIWLTFNNAIIDDSSLVPYLIEKAWYRKLIIVSNKLQHAQWGMLFATYPDNRALGHRLAGMALRLAGHPEQSLGIAPLRDIKIAPNTRIINHLGLSVGAGSNFEIIYE
ncbi:MAG: hypothetical protein ACREYE_21310 [Gammaproteobacteria bacterium]